MDIDRRIHHHSDQQVDEQERIQNDESQVHTHQKRRLCRSAIDFPERDVEVSGICFVELYYIHVHHGVH